MTLLISFLTALLPVIFVILQKELSPENQKRKQRDQIKKAIGRGASGVGDVNRIVDRL